MMKAYIGEMTIPTYRTGAPERLPLFFEKRQYQGASGKIYPLRYTSELHDEKANQTYRTGVVESKYIRAVVMPQIGGKIYSAVMKDSGYEFVYGNTVVKPAMIGLAGPWVSGGIEFNWPQHHRPTTFMPVDFLVKDGKVWVGETEPFYGMHAATAIFVPEGTSLLTAETTVYNASPIAHPFMWWANLAVKIDRDFRVVFPPDTEYVNDHDRRAVLSWPVAKGIYHTGRPFDYGKGTDIHICENIKVPSSFMIAKDQTKGNSVCGYDIQNNRGVVAVSDPRVSPGKKLFTWGNGKFGDQWCANLTDDGSHYAELMAGVYTDNQPDFTYIEPYETKRFTQYWFPVVTIGEVKAATTEGAINLEPKDDQVRIGYCPTRKLNCRISLKREGMVLFQKDITASPDKPYVETVDTVFSVGLSLSVSESGRILVSYTVEEHGKMKPIKPRQPAPDPKDVPTIEELYLHGSHLRQYKHFSFKAEDYFLEGLRRDPGDARCNEAMGDLKLESCAFAEARNYYTRAIERLCMRNPNPEHVEPYYKKGLCELNLDDDNDAYCDFSHAIWAYSCRSSGYFQLAALESRRGNRGEAVRLLRLSLSMNADHFWARVMLSELTEEDCDVNQIDPLFNAFQTNERCATEFSERLIAFGLLDRAADVLEKAEHTALTLYRLGYVYTLRKDASKAKKAFREADQKDPRLFFNRPADIPVLKAAGSVPALYHLGCLYYDKERIGEAEKYWEIGCRAQYAPAMRAQAILLFDKKNDGVHSRDLLEKAFRLDGGGQIFYELTQLYAAINLSLEERLAFYEKHLELTSSRDDTTLDYSVLLSIGGKLDEAERVLLKHRFHTYEGGEGYLTQQHAWLHKLKGDRLFQTGKYEQAMDEYAGGLKFPNNYGEEKTYFVNDAPLYYGMFRCASAVGKGGRKFLEKCTTHGEPTPASRYIVLALKALGKAEEAKSVAHGMINTAVRILKKKACPAYYGVGAPTYKPFHYDVSKNNLKDGNRLLGWGQLALGKVAQAEKAADELLKTDCCDFIAVLLKRACHETI
jgi:tetratricopeptide (TPR) repeat protein